MPLHSCPLVQTAAKYFIEHKEGVFQFRPQYSTERAIADIEVCACASACACGVSMHLLCVRAHGKVREGSPQLLAGEAQCTP